VGAVVECEVVGSELVVFAEQQCWDEGHGRSSLVVVESSGGCERRSVEPVVCLPIAAVGRVVVR
jgi:hypothetical protein